MPFIIEIEPTLLTPKDVDIYRNQMIGILERLNSTVPVPGLLHAAQNRVGMFDDFNADLKNHPRLWAKSSRAGASTIALPLSKQRELGIYSDDPKVKPKADTNTYEQLHARLTKELKRTSYWKKEDTEKRQALNFALEELENLQQNTVLIFQEGLRKASAEKLLAILDEAEKKEGLNSQLHQEIVGLKKRVQELKHADFTKLTTAGEALAYSDQVNKLRNDLLSFSKRYERFHTHAPANDFNHAALQLSIVTKRELDNYYDKPKEKTRLDRAREIAQAVTASIGGVAATIAFILFFIPGFQPLSALFGLISLIALLPVIDKVAEVGRHLANGRTPTKAQAIELGIALPLLSGLIVGAQAFPVIGALIATKSAVIGNAFSSVGNFIATKFMNGFGAVMNLLGGATSSAQLPNSFTPKREDAARKEKVIEFKTGMSIYHDYETHIEDKTKVKAREHSILKALKDHPAKVVYLYKGKKDGEEASIHFAESHHDKIHSWRVGLFSSKDSGRVQEAVREYAALTTNATIQERMQSLEKIITRINEHEHSQFKPLQELSKWVEAEIQILTLMQQQMTAHAIAEEDHKPYLVHKPS